MAILLLIFILLIMILAVIFAIQNSAVVPISYLIWDTEGSLAFILLLALIFGVFIGLLVATPTFIRNRRRITKQDKDIKALQAALDEQTTKLEMIEGQAAEEELPPVKELESEPEEMPGEVPEDAPEDVPELEPELEPEDTEVLVEDEAESVGFMDDTSPAEIEGEVVEETGDEEQAEV